MRTRPPLFLAVLFSLAAAACGSGEPEPATTGDLMGEPGPLVIATDKGSIEGSLVGSTRAFLGVPYAAPPVGDLRWKPPAPHAPWTDTRKVTTHGPSCAQLSILSQSLDSTSSEDCLTLNVWTPERVGASPAPVLVWIHGGAFVFGSSSEPSYDGQVLSEATGAVVVGINYRLGPLGFLAHPSLKMEDPGHPSSGAYGLEDQRAAFEWVKANIGAFGGDPGRVTIFGESAGGMSVCMHMASPKSAGLFQRAIIESGPCDRANAEAAAFAQGDQFVAALGCDSDPAATLDCLRSTPLEEVMKALPSSNDLLFGMGANWFPVVDGWNLTAQPGEILAGGKFEKVPTIIGSNADEGTLFFQLADTKIPDDTALEALCEQLYPGKGKEILAHYSTATHGSAEKAAMAAVGDAGFVCPTRRAARALAKAGVDTYLYHFTYVPPASLLPNLGSFHSAEIKYVFGAPSQLLPQQLTDDELKLSASVMGYWARHAAAGDPNGEGAPAWPKYDAGKDEAQVLDMTITTKAGVKKDLCDFWDSLGPEAP